MNDEQKNNVITSNNKKCEAIATNKYVSAGNQNECESQKERLFAHKLP